MTLLSFSLSTFHRKPMETLHSRRQRSQTTTRSATDTAAEMWTPKVSRRRTSCLLMCICTTENKCTFVNWCEVEHWCYELVTIVTCKWYYHCFLVDMMVLTDLLDKAEGKRRASESASYKCFNCILTLYECRCKKTDFRQYHSYYEDCLINNYRENINKDVNI